MIHIRMVNLPTGDCLSTNKLAINNNDFLSYIIYIYKIIKSNSKMHSVKS